MIILFSSFVLYLLVYGALLMTGLGSMFLIWLLVKDYKTGKIW